MNEQVDDTLQDQLLMNAAMLIERENHIGAGPYQRGVERNGHANRFKPRTFQTAIGALQLAVPQVRDNDTPFRTSLLEKGSRSDRALKSAIVTLYFQGVSTRRVTKVMEELCGFEVSSGQVSNLNKQLDEEFAKWRTRPLPERLLLPSSQPDPHPAWITVAPWSRVRGPGRFSPRARIPGGNAAGNGRSGA